MKLSQEDFLKYATPRLNFLYQIDFDNPQMEKVAISGALRGVAAIGRYGYQNAKQVGKILGVDRAARAVWNGAKDVGNKAKELATQGWDKTKEVAKFGWDRVNKMYDNAAKNIQFQQYNQARAAMSAGKTNPVAAQEVMKNIASRGDIKKGLVAATGVGVGAAGLGAYGMSRGRDQEEN